MKHVTNSFSFVVSFERGPPGRLPKTSAVTKEGFKNTESERGGKGEEMERESEGERERGRERARE
jgi:hypothetical protein